MFMLCCHGYCVKCLLHLSQGHLSPLTPRRKELPLLNCWNSSETHCQCCVLRFLIERVTVHNRVVVMWDLGRSTTKSVRDGAERKSALYVVIIHYSDTPDSWYRHTQINPGLWISLGSAGRILKSSTFLDCNIVL